MKKALAVISFGTTMPSARSAIEVLEKELHTRMEGYDLFRAFTSDMVIRKIQREEGITIPNPGELMEQLLTAGYTHVVCQSLHVIPGDEFEKMCDQLSPYETRFKSFTIGKPLLWGIEDYTACYRALLGYIPAHFSPQEAVVFMGHGTEHPIGAAYSQLENMFRALGNERIYVGTVEGFPDLNYVLARLKKQQIRKVYLYPFMIVAGDHAQKDMAGDGPDSWKSILEAEGYAVEFLMRGLGELPGIADIFISHLQEA